MAVLVEGISVVVRVDSIRNKMSDGWDRFELITPNATMCHDEELARVGFLNPIDVESFVDELISFGLEFVVDGKAVDIVVCDQQEGPTSDCDWIEFGRMYIDGGKVGAAWLFEGERRGPGPHRPDNMKLVTPVDWRFKDSLSDKFEFVPDESKH